MNRYCTWRPVYLALLFFQWEVVQIRVVGKIKIRNLFSVNFCFSENRAVYEIMWKNIVEPEGRPQMTIWRIRISRCVPKATNTHSEYVILLSLPIQQWLHERVSIFTLYVHCLSRFPSIHCDFYQRGVLAGIADSVFWLVYGLDDPGLFTGGNLRFVCFPKRPD